MSHTPLPPNIETPHPVSHIDRSWRGTADLEGGLKCTYYMSDWEAVAAKKARFVLGGPDNLIVISDFDRTISTHFVTNKEGKKVTGHTAYSLLSDSSVMAPAYKAKAKSYHDHYFPLEFDPKVGFEEKVKLMDEWWAKSNKALVDENPELKTLYQAVAESTLQIRKGFPTVVQLCHQYDIPVIVFSAGIRQVIAEILRKLGPTNLLYDNVHIVANRLAIDAEQRVIGFEPPLMHSLNKKDHSINMVKNGTQPWFEPIKHRKNVLLMGDNVGDANMSDGYDEDAQILKVGFLNDNEAELLESYKNAFDIVVLNDGPMVPVANFIKELVSGRNPIHPGDIIPEKQ